MHPSFTSVAQLSVKFRLLLVNVLGMIEIGHMHLENTRSVYSWGLLKCLFALFEGEKPIIWVYVYISYCIIHRKEKWGKCSRRDFGYNVTKSEVFRSDCVSCPPGPYEMSDDLARGLGGVSFKMASSITCVSKRVFYQISLSKFAPLPARTTFFTFPRAVIFG